METRYYLYPVHTSRTFLHMPTLAASFYLILLRLLGRNYSDAFKLTEACTVSCMFVHLFIFFYYIWRFLLFYCLFFCIDISRWMLISLPKRSTFLTSSIALMTIFTRVFHLKLMNSPLFFKQKTTFFYTLAV